MLNYKDRGLQTLEGSPALDAIKRKHKAANEKWYACDIDFVLISRSPFSILTAIDFKQRSTDPGRKFASSVAYKILLEKGIRVHIIYFDWTKGGNPEFNNIDIWELMHCDPSPDPVEWKAEIRTRGGTWRNFEEWEREIRQG